jgi:hypothetical protein
LLPVGAHGLAPVVPNQRRRVKADFPAGLLDAPANVDVIACGPELRIETTDRAQPLDAKRHVATRNVLGFAVREQHVRGPTGRVGHRFGHQTVAGRRQVRAADGGVLGRAKAVRQVVKPVRIRIGVIVGVGDDLAARQRQAQVARVAQAAVFRLDQSHVVAAYDVRGVVRRTIVDHDDLAVRIAQLDQALQAIADGRAAVERTHDHRDARPVRPGERRLLVRAAHRLQRRLRPPFAIGQPELPVVDFLATAMPFIRPRKHERAGRSARERRSNLPVQHACLLVAPVAHAVEPHLAEQQRPLIGDDLQPRQIGVESILGLQIDVETHQIQKRQAQIFGGRIVDVRDQALGIFFFYGAIQFAQIAFDARRADPAHQLGWNLVAERVAEQRRVTRAAAHLRPDLFSDIRRVFGIDKVSGVLLGRKPDHDLEAMLIGDVQERPRWHRVWNANGVDAVRGHLREVAIDLRQVVVLALVLVGTERAISHAANEELLMANAEEFPLNRTARASGSARRR